MSLSPGSQFSLQLIDSLSQQIGEGQQRVNENQILSEILPQIQQAQTPQDLLSLILTPGLRPETQQQISQFASPFASAARQQPQAQTEQERSDFKNTLLKLGVPEDEAELWSRSSPGTQTALIKDFLDRRSRGGQPGIDQIPNVDEQGNVVGEQSIPDQNDFIDQNPEQSFDFQFPKLPSLQGKTPKEITQIQRDREKSNQPIFLEQTEKFSNLQDENRLIDRLQGLNESDQLPEGLGRINVNPRTGDLLLPAGANAETQLYIKTINEFTRNVKNSFGARITNFELGVFLKRLPTLANTAEGRSLILKQMEIVNELNMLDAESKIATYNNYGIENVNAQQASKIADQFKKERQKVLLERFKTLDGSIRSLSEQPQNQQDLNKILFG
jgi:hypothetical protein